MDAIIAQKWQKCSKVAKTAGWFVCRQHRAYFVCMAKQIGLLRITGTLDGICFYCMDGMYYAREKSSLSAERVKNDPVFSETMRHAKRMSDASKIASAIYRETVPKSERSREKYREVVGMVMRELAKDDPAVWRKEEKPGSTPSKEATDTLILVSRKERKGAEMQEERSPRLKQIQRFQATTCTNDDG